MQRELRLTEGQKADLKAARQTYLAKLGANVKERQGILRTLATNMPIGANNKATAAR